jgi:hypothetical protein
MLMFESMMVYKIPLRSFEVPITPAEKTTSLTKLRCASRCARSGPGYALIYHNGGIYMDTDFLAIDMSSIIDPCDGSREKTIYPLVNQHTMENHHFYWENKL